MLLRWIFALVLVASVAQNADAHFRLTSHDSRYGDEQKAEPCGVANGARTTDKVYIARPGTQVTLVWEEFINHQSFFRIDFDLEGDDSFSNPILPCADQYSIVDCFDLENTGPYMANNITDEPAEVQSYVYTLPDVECDRCTLQVIQAMQDKPPFTDPGNEIYYQCLDIILAADGPNELTLVDMLAAPDAGPSVDSGPLPDGGAETAEESGCQTAATSGHGLWLVALAGLWCRRRRANVPTSM